MRLTMATYHLSGDIVRLGLGEHSVIVSAIPGPDEISALRVIVRRACEASSTLARVARDRLLEEIRALVIAHGDSIAAGT